MSSRLSKKALIRMVSSSTDVKQNITPMRCGNSVWALIRTSLISLKSRRMNTCFSPTCTTLQCVSIQHQSLRSNLLRTNALNADTMIYRTTSYRVPIANSFIPNPAACPAQLVSTLLPGATSRKRQASSVKLPKSQASSGKLQAPRIEAQASSRKLQARRF